MENEQKEPAPLNWQKDILPEQLVDAQGKSQVTHEALKGKRLLGLYFSARWCAPCRNFTPVLASFYASCLKKADDSIQIVFVSSDQNEEVFKEYLGKMPWLAVPFEEQTARAKLSELCKVQGIPTLVVMDGETGAIKSFTGRQDVVADTDAVRVLNKWHIAEKPALPNDAQRTVKRMQSAFYMVMACWMAYKGNIPLAAMMIFMSVMNIRR